MVRRLLVASACAASYAAAATDAAFAERATIRDPRDASAPWDVTRVVVQNGRDSLRIRFVYRGVVRVNASSTGFLANVRLDVGAPSDSTYSPDFSLDLLRGSEQYADRSQLLRHRGTRAHRVRCAGLRMRIRRRSVRFTVPQRCFGNRPDRVRVNGFSYQVRGPAGRADYIDAWSRWVTRG